MSENTSVEVNKVDLNTAISAAKIANEEIAGLPGGKEFLSNSESPITLAVLDSLEKRGELQEENLRDQLTGLFNRRYVDKVITERENQKDPRPIAVISCDLDHFKQVNDSYGHSAGDDVLKSVSEAFLINTRISDSVIRIGGEEFLILLDGVDDPVTAKNRAEDIRRAVKSTRIRANSQKQEVNLEQTVSVGVSICNSGDDLREKINTADVNLYRAKEGGRDKVVV
ncbi:MAG: Diguanylate cyclase with PAS/PAC and GAF sensor [Microgenomates group bacterium GW2011_GWC1_41_20]|uniref:Diguanylate cyclase with PAS/PAC and GAF sensor n=6 Tax=Candidatus Woeseibacteriota TaxID=1752722 RepID=A0A0G0S0W5_9BACT|nr:MAG: Diguanylate cyclase with PAS/PAC and GAF sensor [Candidatus Woesebacteria bacterium GW2011_GWB1_40_12]KKR55866.1 MAG: Diguanylate cyclase with PAS/PAC and GAF sensor [Candidatus Woesebacteria bacterium GW2011_GWF1_40_24]KKR90785.1 MAG: Diguanylate cyclase with PAS/PAC and GAF sensor [Candidatus Woesebacteria bacterium GW2011_GWD1_41_12]KKR99395.1 MAG: Diguanylate cyclase with PAS/PAC and GAF sensor [Microgenomates group bacterium GW2011_GWC1_41_20]KKS04973.1 MAG: Diguanylate cyclase wit